MFDEITIIGPGLIGASLGLALKSKKICKKILASIIPRKILKMQLKSKQLMKEEGQLILGLKKVQ